jgi:hypothetical protein
MVPFASIITSITVVFTFYMHSVSIVRSLCIRIFSASVFITFLSSKIQAFIIIYASFSLARIMMSGLLLGGGRDSVNFHLLIP